MKIKNLYIAFLLLALIVSGACEKFLEENPKDVVTVDKVYNTDEDLTFASNGVYGALIGFYRAANTNWNIYYTDEVRGDDIKKGPSASTSAYDTWERGLYNSSAGDVNNLWNNMFRSIKDANILIDKAPKASGASDATKAQVIAESRCLRAFYYFQLVKLFGDVPLITNVFTDVSSLGTPRAPVQDVYNQILTDLTFCAGGTAAYPGLPLSYSSDMNRVTLNAARTMLAEVYMTMPLKNYVKADSLLKKVRDSKQNTLFANYKDVFMAANKNVALTKAGTKYTNGENILMVYFHNDYDPPGGAALPSTFNPRDAIVGSTNQGGLGNLVATPQAFNLYDPADLRRSIIFPFTYVNKNGATLNFPHTNSTGNGYKANATEYYINKYTIEGQNAPWRWSQNPIYVYRYADVLLLLAEANNEVNSGPTIDAYNALKEVRDRAGLPTPAMGTYSYTTFKEDVIKEARMELLGDARRYSYQLRLGTLISDLAAIGQTLDPAKILLPIPQTELDNNAAMKQNPGY